MDGEINELIVLLWTVRFTSFVSCYGWGEQRACCLVMNGEINELVVLLWTVRLTSLLSCYGWGD